MEKWDVYDIHKNKIENKVVNSADELEEGEYNLITACWVCNSKGSY